MCPDCQAPGLLQQLAPTGEDTCEGVDIRFADTPTTAALTNRLHAEYFQPSLAAALLAEATLAEAKILEARFTKAEAEKEAAREAAREAEREKERENEVEREKGKETANNGKKEDAKKGKKEAAKEDKEGVKKGKEVEAEAERPEKCKAKRKKPPRYRCKEIETGEAKKEKAKGTAEVAAEEKTEATAEVAAEEETAMEETPAAKADMAAQEETVKEEKAKEEMAKEEEKAKQPFHWPAKAEELVEYKLGCVPPTHVLMRRYFEYMLATATGSDCLTVRGRGGVGRAAFLIPKATAWPSVQPAWPDGHHRLSIEDPFETHDSPEASHRHDCASSLTEAGMARLLDEWKRAAGLLLEAEKLEAEASEGVDGDDDDAEEEVMLVGKAEAEELGDKTGEEEERAGEEDKAGGEEMEERAGEGGDGRAPAKAAKRPTKQQKACALFHQVFAVQRF